MYNYGDCSPRMTNCIFWGNSDEQIYDEEGSTSVVTYSCIQGCGVFCADPDDHNIDENPLFVSGPDGDYYLSQVVSGQSSNSPCVDAGGEATTFWVGELTTRTDGEPDTDRVDMGFHYEPNIQFALRLDPEDVSFPSGKIFSILLSYCHKLCLSGKESQTEDSTNIPFHKGIHRKPVHKTSGQL